MAKPNNVRSSINNFMRHVEELEAEEDPEGNGFNREYRLIQEMQVRNRRENKFSMDIGKAEINLRKNRYKDILPYDDHRVALQEIEGDEGSDYINASKLMGAKNTGGYIATQGPLAATVNDFWRMVWEYKVEIIFMACRIVELGKIKCKQYWNDKDKSDEFGDITVFTESEEKLDEDFIERKFRLKRGEEERRVIQFQYSGWPDHGIPDDPKHIKELIRIMRETRKDSAAPLVVHCRFERGHLACPSQEIISGLAMYEQTLHIFYPAYFNAGCGRTGAIIAIDYVWTMLDEGKFNSDFNLFDLICSFREQRMSIVQTADQYALVNKVLKTLCEEWLTKMASHTYENVELNQEYSNIDSNEPPSAKENIYEDAVTFNSQKTEERLLGSADLGPEIIDLPIAPKPPVNGTEQKEKKKTEKAPAPPSPGGKLRRLKDHGIPVSPSGSYTLYSCCAEQYGAPPLGFQDAIINRPIRAQESKIQYANKVTYVVQPGPQNATSSTSSAASLPPVSPTSPKPVSPSATAQPPKSSNDTAIYSQVHKGKPQPAAAAAPASDMAVYAVVNKTKSAADAPASASAVYAEVQKSPGRKSAGTWQMSNSADGAYSEIWNCPPQSPVLTPTFDSPYSEIMVTSPTGGPGSPGGASGGGRILSTGSADSGRGGTSPKRVVSDTSSSQQIGSSGQPPGFNERLPKVKGPVPMPQSWTQ